MTRFGRKSRSDGEAPLTTEGLVASKLRPAPRIHAAGRRGPLALAAVLFALLVMRTPGGRRSPRHGHAG